MFGITFHEVQFIEKFLDLFSGGGFRVVPAIEFVFEICSSDVQFRPERFHFIVKHAVLRGFHLFLKL